MFLLPFRTLLFGGFLLLGLPGRHSLLPTAAAQDAPDPNKAYTYVEQMPMLPGRDQTAVALTAAVEQRLVLPAGAPEREGRVFVRFIVEKNGIPDSLEIVKGVGPVQDAAVLAAVRRLPAFTPGRQNGRLVRVSFTLPVTLHSPAARQAAAQRLETQTVKQGIAERRPGETDSTFLRRVLPIAYPASTDLLAYAWRPSAFGKQLFFSAPAGDEGYYKTNLFVLDPFAPTTYAVQCFNLNVNEGCDVAPTLEAIFFADLNQDGQKELLALASCSSREPIGRDRDGVGQFAHESHFATLVYQYAGFNSVSRPLYRLDHTPRAYLNGLETVAAVRQALAKHQAKPAPPKAAAPPARGAK